MAMDRFGDHNPRFDRLLGSRSGAAGVAADVE
jgi:hypothetical protein